MNILLRNRRTIYYCEMYLENGIEVYKKPKKVKINFNPTNSSSQVVAYGNTYPLYLKGIIMNSLDIKFKEGDKCYIYKTPKTTNTVDKLCKEADYIIDSEPLITLNSTEVSFKRLTSDMNYE